MHLFVLTPSLKRYNAFYKWYIELKNYIFFFHLKSEGLCINTV